ncbi:unnamed protein product [Arabidopsis arenosa]|uniref:F-box associated beta-propeller type 1 domain-containing protein n=1 Tax=Arabidopsis arenosa TaxID=38785 RepID=A0A8S2A1D1_ARAAE|nr:unnamed protein product [Arabidopsis arenosa]
MTKGTAFWNPWLKQVKWIDFEDKDFDACGLGYDNTRDEKVYKILGSFMCRREVAIYDCTSQAFKFIDTPNEDWSITDVQRSSVSLNGNLYWISPIPDKFDFCEFLIRSFDFSRDIFKPFCLLPCRKMDFCDLLVLQVFNENRLSLLKQCYKTRKVEIWVTKKKIDSSNYNSGEEVVWISLLTFPSSNLPNLCNKRYDISYFIYDKTTLIMCCGDDGGGTPCIYIVRGDFFKKIQINSGVFRCCHCIYAPNFIPVPLEIIGLDGVDPTIKLRVLDSSGIPYREKNSAYITITACDEFLFCNSWNNPQGTALWNPWLKQVKWIEYEDKGFHVCGLGYDNTRDEKAYKILGSFMCLREESSYEYHQRVAIYECASHAFKFIDTGNEHWPLSDVERLSVSLNGNLYWLHVIPGTVGIFIRCFDFSRSREILKLLCLAPCGKLDESDVLVLQVFNENRLSLLKQYCYVTRKVEIWVTKKKITSNNSGEEVVWIRLLTLQPSGTPCIYIVRGDLFKKIQIDSGVYRCCHCVYAPNFIPVPLGFRLLA